MNDGAVRAAVGAEARDGSLARAWTLESFADQRSGVVFLLFHGNFVLLDMKTAATSMTCLGGETGIRYKVGRVLATFEIPFNFWIYLSFGCVHSFVRVLFGSICFFFFCKSYLFSFFALVFFPVRPFIRYGDFFFTK
jgi:hypothetical protein